MCPCAEFNQILRTYTIIIYLFARSKWTGAPQPEQRACSCSIPVNEVIYVREQSKLTENIHTRKLRMKCIIKSHHFLCVFYCFFSFMIYFLLCVPL